MSQNEVDYDEGDRFTVQDEVDLWIDGDLQSVYVEEAEIESLSVYWEDGETHENVKLAYYDPVGDEITTDSLDLDDIREADGDWMHRQ